MRRTAAEFEANLRWADFDTFAYEAADADSSFDLNEVFRLPQFLGGAWTAKKLSLTALGLFEARTAPITCKTIFDLVMICVDRKKRLRDQAQIGSEVLTSEYSWSAEAIERAHQVIRLIPGLTGSGREAETAWSVDIFRGALLEYRLVASVDDVWRVLQRQAIDKISTLFQGGEPFVDTTNFRGSTEADDTGVGNSTNDDLELQDHLWRPQHVRIFLSHIHEHAAFAQQVCDGLREFQIDGFVAHTSIEPSRLWQDEIEHALNTADAYVGLLHPQFSQSIWTQQEMGWALGRRIPTLMIHLGEDPKGFQGRFQASRSDPSSAQMTATRIIVWLSTLAPFGPEITQRLVESLQNAHSFIDARNAAMRLEEIGRLSPPILDAIRNAYLKNDQIAGHIAEPILYRIMKGHGRDLPPRSSF